MESAMKYISTRGRSTALSFSEILLGGLAPDGGLYLPETYPRFDAVDLAAMRKMDYRELAFAILSRLADDIPADDLDRKSTRLNSSHNPASRMPSSA
jgi:threonine synthase